MKISLTVFNSQRGHEVLVEMAIFNVQRSKTPKVGNSEVGFMCSAHRLVVFYICVKFHENISNGFQLTERTDTSTW